LTKDIGNYYPYNLNTVELTLNSEDSIYLQQGGEYALLNLVKLGSDYSAGFLGSLTVGVESNGTDSSATSSVSTSSTSKAPSGTTVAGSTTTVGAVTTQSSTSWGSSITASMGLFAAILISVLVGSFLS